MLITWGIREILGGEGERSEPVYGGYSSSVLLTQPEAEKKEETEEAGDAR